MLGGPQCTSAREWSVRSSPVRIRCGMFVMCCVSVSSVLTRGCAVSGRHINVYNIDVLLIFTFTI